MKGRQRSQKQELDFFSIMEKVYKNRVVVLFIKFQVWYISLSWKKYKRKMKDKYMRRSFYFLRQLLQFENVGKEFLTKLCSY